MAFLDLDEIEQDSKDANIIPHPLKDKLAESEKAAYINAIVFAGLADDDTLSDIELEYGRTRALSLGLNADDFDEAVKTVQSLNGPKERKEFLFEMFAAFTDRTVAMYVLCDMAQAMASDGDLTDDAVKFLDSLYRLLLKSDKKPDNPLTPADQKFLSAYRPFLSPGKTADASEVVQTYRLEEYEFPVGLVQFFSPNLKPVQLKGGMSGSGEIRLVGGKYRIDEKFEIAQLTKLIIKDADIEFGPQGGLVILGSDVSISDTQFRATGETSLTEMLKSYAKHLLVSNCVFDGGNVRGAVRIDGTCCNLELVNCRFSGLVSGESVIDVQCGDLICRRCDFVGCKTTGPNLVYGMRVICDKCDFISCCAKDALVTINGMSGIGIFSHNYCDLCSFMNCAARELLQFIMPRRCYADRGAGYGFVSKAEFDKIRMPHRNDA